MSDLTREQEEVMERLCLRHGGVAVLRMPDSEAVVMVGRVDDVEMGDHLLVPPEGMGMRLATAREVQRASRKGDREGTR